VATSVAAALASLVVAFSGIAFGRLEGTAPLGVWAAQTFVLAAMLGGVRHAVRVPADLRASGPFLIAWPGDDRRYLSGVKRAVLMSVVVPAIVLLLPLHVVLLGWSTGLLHALCGFALATVLLEALFYGIGHPPFICAYVPAGSFKRAMPIYFAGVVVGCSLIAGIERAAISHRHGSAILLATLAVVALALGWGDRRGRQTPVDVEIDLAPDPAVQRFDLSG
jgi:hypothetical protein